MTDSDIERLPDTSVVEVAHELDSQIRHLAHHAHVVLDALRVLVEEAKAENIHEALGFPSWTAYLADALDGEWNSLLESDKRKEAVRFLAEQGMSQRAIARVVGISKNTVTADLRGVPTLGQVITGLDGKEYPRPEPGVPTLGQVDAEEETDAAFLARMEEQRWTFTVPRTVEEMTVYAERFNRDEQRLRRLRFDMELAAIRASDDTPAMKDAREFGLRMRYLGRLAREAIEDGMSIEEFAEQSGCPVQTIRDHLAYLATADEEGDR